MSRVQFAADFRPGELCLTPHGQFILDHQRCADISPEVKAYLEGAGYVLERAPKASPPPTPDAPPADVIAAREKAELLRQDAEVILDARGLPSRKEMLAATEQS